MEDISEQAFLGSFPGLVLAKPVDTRARDRRRRRQQQLRRAPRPVVPTPAPPSGREAEVGVQLEASEEEAGDGVESPVEEELVEELVEECW